MKKRIPGFQALERRKLRLRLSHEAELIKLMAKRLRKAKRKRDIVNILDGIKATVEQVCQLDLEEL